MTCAGCGAACSTRFCSNPCLIGFSRSQRGVECAICQWDPEAGRPGNPHTHRLCTPCNNAPENCDWREPSDFEQGTEDVDNAIAAIGGGRLEGVFGGRRKFDSEMAAKVVRIALRETVTRRRRRRGTSGKIVRGWTTVEESGLSLREIARRAGCSHEYVRQVLKRVLG